MTDLEAYLTTNKRIWYNSIALIAIFGKDELNALYLDGKIEVRNGLNVKVIRLK